MAAVYGGERDKTRRAVMIDGATLVDSRYLVFGGSLLGSSPGKREGFKCLNTPSRFILGTLGRIAGT